MYLSFSIQLNCISVELIFESFSLFSLLLTLLLDLFIMGRSDFNSELPFSSVSDFVNIFLRFFSVFLLFLISLIIFHSEFEIE